MPPRSRGARRPSCVETCPSMKQRAQGRPGARRTHGPLCGKNAQGQDHRCRRRHPSLRNGFNGVLRALPGDRAFLPPSFCRSSPITARSGSTRHPQTLAPASGRQNHTTSPSATTSLVLRAATAHGKPALRSALRARHSRVHRIPAQRP
jgi:hypothetical protein